MSIENESEGLQEVVEVYIIKDRKIEGTGALKRWFPLKDVERLIEEEQEHKGLGLDLSLTGNNGKEVILTFNPEETQDSQSVTIRHYLTEVPGNNN